MEAIELEDGDASFASLVLPSLKKALGYLLGPAGWPRNAQIGDSNSTPSPTANNGPVGKGGGKEIWVGLGWRLLSREPVTR